MPVPASRATIGQARAEIAWQNNFAARFESSEFAKPDGYQEEIRTLVGQLDSPGTGQQALAQIINRWGTNAVPSLIRLLADERWLPYWSIRVFPRMPNPEDDGLVFPAGTVWHLLHLVLTHLTHEDLVSVEENPQQISSKALAAWRVWLYHQLTDRSAPKPP